MKIEFVMPNPLLEVFRALLFGSDNAMITENGNNILIAV